MSIRLAVFGAHGATGQILTKEALARGYYVTAAARQPEHLEQQVHTRAPSMALVIRVPSASMLIQERATPSGLLR